MKMTKDEMLDELSVLYERFDNGMGWRDGNYTEALDLAIESLSAEPKWIPCSERLPSENGFYIASLEDAVYPWATFHNGTWFMLSVDNMARAFGAHEVIAWQPLPKPYREDGEE